MAEKGKLYVVATPIGNMEDLSPRALRVLAEADFVLCEDTRVTGRLLSVCGQKKPLLSYHEHNKLQRGEDVIARLISGESAAIVTDAGTPCVSDPGMELVAAAHESGIEVVAVPGPCAAAAAVSVSGIDCRRFVFEGFLEKDNASRRERLTVLAQETRPIVFYVSVHEYSRVVGELLENFGDRRVAVCRELTKLNEQTLSTTLARLTDIGVTEKGEFVLVVAGADPDAEGFWSEMSIQEHVAWYVAQGKTGMEAMKLVAAERRMPKSAVYREINGKKQTETEEIS